MITGLAAIPPLKIGDTIVIQRRTYLITSILQDSGRDSDGNAYINFDLIVEELISNPSQDN
jgi:hypothetical protein